MQHNMMQMPVEGYIALNENDLEHRYEYIDGEVYMRPMENVRHAAIGAHVGCLLENGLEESLCVTYNSMAWVQLAETRYVYPDVTVSCSLLNVDDEEEEAKTVQCPCVVIEVSSLQTQARDQTIKVRVYQECPTIQEILLIDTLMPQVQLYRRESNNRWTIYLLTVEDEIELTSLDVHFPVAALYRKTRLSKSSDQ
jgi:Uma2 family endonuclease